MLSNNIPGGESAAACRRERSFEPGLDQGRAVRPVHHLHPVHRLHRRREGALAAAAEDVHGTAGISITRVRRLPGAHHHVAAGTCVATAGADRDEATGAARAIARADGDVPGRPGGRVARRDGD